MFNLEEIFIEICTSNFLSSYQFFNLINYAIFNT